MVLKKPVKIRSEIVEGFLAYFVELRRFIPVNELGADIIDAFFNKDKTSKQIQQLYGLKSKEQINGFLKSIKAELETPFAGGYPLLKDDFFSIPIAVELNIIKKCNLRCRHCSLMDYEKVMPLKEIKRILSILYKNKVFELNITGGEVFLHPHIMEILELACEKYNFAVSIVTNATLLSDRVIKKIKKYNNLLMVLLSLEGVGEENDKIRGKGVFEKVDFAIRRLKKAGFHVEISSTINSQNIDKASELIDYAKRLDVPLNFNLFKVVKEEHKGLILDPPKYFSFIDYIFEKRSKYYSKIGLTNAAISSYKTTKKKRKTCRAALSGLTINVDGRMVTCPFLSEARYYKNDELPKIDDNFVKTWQHNKKFNEFRLENLNECVACSYLFAGSVKSQDPYGLQAYIEYSKPKIF